MKAIKYMVVVVFALVMLFIFVTNFSASESRFQCSGLVSLNRASTAATVYLKLERYRWWVGLWSDSDANLLIEIPSEVVENYGHVIEVGQQLQIYSFEKSLRGNLSLLSNSLSLQTSRGFFDGECTIVNSKFLR
jgi:hypothetical protein